MPTALHPATQAWLQQQGIQATPTQQQAWQHIAQGHHCLIAAPTGSGKTLAGFLAIIDALIQQDQGSPLPKQTQVVYISPLKALSNDIDKNLKQPLTGIAEQRAQLGLPGSPITSAVRTGDTPQNERQRMRRQPPHILVTTPESLFILLGSDSGRAGLRHVRHLIIDEIHALAANKRGTHLSLSIERLAALSQHPLQRIGLSATQRPIDTIADYLQGGAPTAPQIIDHGHQRQLDLKLLMPGEALEAIPSAQAWDSIYQQIHALSQSHRTLLIFTNTRRSVERVAKALAETLTPADSEPPPEHQSPVAAHHGSLSKEHRLRAEQRLKAGELRIMVASASLELGIDIGDIDLVIQLGSPGAIATLLQRIGRAGHRLDATPKGRLIPLSRDDLVECVALLQAITNGELDQTHIPQGPQQQGHSDVLAQHLISEVAAQTEADEQQLYQQLRRAAPYRSLSEQHYDAILNMLADGYATRRGKRGAYLYRDQVQGQLRPRPAARLTALTNAGAIPDHFDADVILEPEGIPIGSLNEDFAFETLAGDIFQLGNHSYRVLHSGQGQVHVQDAQGQPPNIPFWFGEAPGRSDQLSHAVARLRSQAQHHYDQGQPEHFKHHCQQQLGLDEHAAEQLNHYLQSAHAALQQLPDARHILLERFFDQVGDQHLIIHSPNGSRINKAWGLALRKRFCRHFNFELQAAANEDAILLSLGPTHSFPLDDIRHYLKANNVRHILTQAVLDSPIFETRWRWAANISLAVARYRHGKKVPPQFQRMDAEDLIAVLFPDQLACLENIQGDRQIPDHPLVQQALHDALTDAMDIDGLEQLLRQIEAGTITLINKELSEPSPLAREIINAKPYAFLDDAPAEERRSQQISARRQINPQDAAQSAQLQASAIDHIRQQAWPLKPQTNTPDALHDAIDTLGYLRQHEHQPDDHTALDQLQAQQRITQIQTRADSPTLYISAERLPQWQNLLDPSHPQTHPIKPVGRRQHQDWNPESALADILHARLQHTGPTQAQTLAEQTGLPQQQIQQALTALQSQGSIHQGRYDLRQQPADCPQWCERHLLARIHRQSHQQNRQHQQRHYPAADPAAHQRFLFQWQRIGPNNPSRANNAQNDPRPEGLEALAGVLLQLEGSQHPPAHWQQHILPARLKNYRPADLDPLCQSGRYLWQTHPKADTGQHAQIRHSRISLIRRSHRQHWPNHPKPLDQLSARAQLLYQILKAQGPSFQNELQQQLKDQHAILPEHYRQAQNELITAGHLQCDSYSGLQQQTQAAAKTRRRRRHPPAPLGRWSLAPEPTQADPQHSLDTIARALLRRWGIVTQAIVKHDSAQTPPWKQLRQHYLRLEAQGQIQGGRFLKHHWGDQFAHPQAAAQLQQIQTAPDPQPPQWQSLNACDPLNLSALHAKLQADTAPTPIPKHPDHQLHYKNGHLLATEHQGITHPIEATKPTSPSTLP